MASLSGEKWLSFLNQTAGESLFQQSPGNRVEEAALRKTEFSSEEAEQLRGLAAEWIRRHRVQA